MTAIKCMTFWGMADQVHMMLDIHEDGQQEGRGKEERERNGLRENRRKLVALHVHCFNRHAWTISMLYIIATLVFSWVYDRWCCASSLPCDWPFPETWMSEACVMRVPATRLAADWSDSERESRWFHCCRHSVGCEVALKTCSDLKSTISKNFITAVAKIS